MNRTIRVLGLLFAGVLVLSAAPTAMAIGTSSGTSVDNSATIDYSIGGSAQPQITSNITTFVVDNRVDLTVVTVDAAAVNVVPGGLAQVLTYTVTNNGNTVQDYRLQALASAVGAFGLVETIDALNVNVFVDGDANGTYEVATDTGTYVDELAEDATITVFIVADIPVAAVTGDVASYDLLATTADGGAGGALGADSTDDAGIADNPATVETVFGDGAGSIDAVTDGQHSSLDGYLVFNVVLAMVKSMAVADDPFNGAVNPKAIPGARVTYTLDVTNTGTADADNVVIEDAIPVGTAFLVGSVTATGTVAYSNDGGMTWVYAPVADANGTDLAVTHVQVTYLAIVGGAPAEQVIFDVVIQ